MSRATQHGALVSQPWVRAQLGCLYWPCVSNPVRLGSYVSRAIARREIAGLRPGFWQQGQSNHPTPLRIGRRALPMQSLPGIAPDEGCATQRAQIAARLDQRVGCL